MRPRRLSQAASLIPQAQRQARVLPHVRVNEEAAARRQHPVRLGQHRFERLAGEMLEHVQRVGLGERGIGEGQLAQIGECQVDPDSASSAKNGLTSTPTDRGADLLFQTSARPLPQPRSINVSPRDGASWRRSTSLRTPAASSGGETCSWRASACSASFTYFVISANA